MGGTPSPWTANPSDVLLSSPTRFAETGGRESARDLSARTEAGVADSCESFTGNTGDDPLLKSPCDDGGSARAGDWKYADEIDSSRGLMVVAMERDLAADPSLRLA